MTRSRPLRSPIFQSASAAANATSGDSSRRHALKLAFADGAELNDGQFADLCETTALVPNGASFRLRPGAHAGKVLKRLLDLGVKVSKFEEAQASMHEIFVQVVTGRDAAGAAPGQAAGQGGPHAN